MWTSFWLGVMLVGTRSGQAGAGAEAGSHVTDAHAQELFRGKGTGIGLQDQGFAETQHQGILSYHTLAQADPHLSFASVMLT